MFENRLALRVRAPWKLALGAVMVLQVLANGAANWVRFLQTEILQEYINRKIHEKSVGVNRSHAADPAFQW